MQGFETCAMQDDIIMSNEVHYKLYILFRTVISCFLKLIALCLCNCCRLLHIRTANCQFSAAKDSYEQAVELASQLESSSCASVSWIPISLGKCHLLFAMNHYREVLCT